MHSPSRDRYPCVSPTGQLASARAGAISKLWKITCNTPGFPPWLVAIIETEHRSPVSKLVAMQGLGRQGVRMAGISVRGRSSPFGKG